MKDILLDSDIDIAVRHGDLIVGESTQQHQQLLLLHHPGHVKQFGFVGAGLLDYLNDDNMGGLYREAEKQYTLDGMKVKKLEIYEDGNVITDATYE